MLAPARSTRQQRSFERPLHRHLAQLKAAASADERLEVPLLDATRALGFDGFLYAVCTCDARPRLWSASAGEWQALYQERRYIDIDPRFTHTRNRAAPYVWDGAIAQGEWQVQQFLQDAARFGICSGVAVSVHRADHARIVLALDSRITPVTPPRRDAIERRLGDVMLLATSLHDILSACRSTPESAAGRARGSLSIREKECLRLAARGMTSADIGSKLGITERTANFHFSNLIGKLGVINRHEAIARAVQTGLI